MVCVYWVHLYQYIILMFGILLSVHVMLLPMPTCYYKNRQLFQHVNMIGILCLILLYCTIDVVPATINCCIRVYIEVVIIITVMLYTTSICKYLHILVNL